MISRSLPRQPRSGSSLGAALAQTVFMTGASGSSGDLFVQVSDGQAFSTVAQFEIDVRKTTADDFNRDGFSDVLWRDNSTGAVGCWRDQNRHGRSDVPDMSFARSLRAQVVFFRLSD